MSDLLETILPHHLVDKKARNHLLKLINSTSSDREISVIINTLKLVVSQIHNQSNMINEESALNIAREVRAHIDKTVSSSSKRTFKSLINNSTDKEETSKAALLSLVTKDLVKYEFIYNFSIIYVDAFTETPNPVEVLNQHNSKIEFNPFTQFNELGKKKSINHGIGYLPNPIEKSNMFLNHLEIVRHFVYLHSSFKNPLNHSKDAVSVLSLDSLQGNHNIVVVIGVLLIGEDGLIHLQDERTKIKLDITSCNWDKAYFTPTSVVLCEGQFNDEVFKVHYLLQPPIPEKNRTFTDKIEQDFFGATTKIIHRFKEKPKDLKEVSTLDYFLKKGTFEHQIKTTIFPASIATNLKNLLSGIKSNSADVSINKHIFLSSQELISENPEIVIISNLCIEDSNCLNDLKTLLQKLNGNPPTMFVLMGNFLPDSSFKSFKNQKQYFDKLASTIAEESNINDSSIFCFIPGNHDIQISSGFPIPQLPDFIVDILSKKIKHVIAATNPCRFSIFGKEFVFFRDELHKKMARNSIGFLDKDINRQKYYLNTLFGQGILSPLEQEKSPRVWHLSHSLLFFPPPDFLIVADLTQDFYSLDNPQTIFINPGSFSKDTSFMYVNPLKLEVQSCKIKSHAITEPSSSQQR